MYRQNYGLGSLVSTIVKNNPNLFNPVSAFPTQYGGITPLMSGMSTPQTTRYGRKYGLSLPMVDYLNAPLPDISGLFAPAGQPAINPIYDPDDDGTKDEILEDIAAQDSGGDSFNPYDVRPGDPGIRTYDQYNPYAYNQAMRNTEKFGQTVGPNPDLYYAPLTDIEQLMSKIPTPLGFVKKGLDAIADRLPPNRTAIFQNELLGQGIKLDNIGRIVTDNYNTPEGIMAGYNPVSGGLLNMLTGGAYGEPTTYGLEKSVAERQENIRNTLQDKYGLSNEQIDDVLSEIEETGTYTGPLGFNQIMGKTTNLFEDLFNLDVFNQKQLDAKKKADIIFEQQLKEKRESDPAFIEQQKIEKAAETRRDFQQAVAEAEKQKTGYTVDDLDLIEGQLASGFSDYNRSSAAKAEAAAAAARESAIAQEAANREAAREAAAAAAAARAREEAAARSREEAAARAREEAAARSREEAAQAARDKAIREKDLGSGPPGIGGGGGGGGDGCFLKGTLVTMLDGSKKEIEKIDLGDEVAKGGKVFATGKFLVNNLYDYKGIKVSGSHMVFEEGNWTRVEDSKYGKALGDEEHTVYVFGCENRRILIEDILFTDYFEVKDQDKLIEDKEKFFDNWKTFANNEDRKNVNTLNAN